MKIEDVKIGMKVRASSPLTNKQRDELPKWIGEMDEMDGKVMTVTGISRIGHVEVDETIYAFHPKWLEEAE